MSRPQYGTPTPTATQPAPVHHSAITRPPTTQRFSRKVIWSLVLSILWLGGPADPGRGGLPHRPGRQGPW